MTSELRDGFWVTKNEHECPFRLMLTYFSISTVDTRLDGISRGISSIAAESTSLHMENAREKRESFCDAKMSILH